MTPSSPIKLKNYKIIKSRSLEIIWKHGPIPVFKNINFYSLLKINFFMFLNRFNVLILKIIFLKKNIILMHF